MKKRGISGIYEEIINPLSEFKLKDVLQVIVGASILAIPVAFTEETWRMGESLPVLNISLLAITSIVFIGLFVYYNYHKEHKLIDLFHFAKRVFSTYIIAFLVVALLLTIIQKAPWQTDYILAIKRIILVSFPASMSGTIADRIK